ncbi:MAG TPA: tRNA (cytidine(56)-2'-O)-methyltransferase [Nitrososphaeraceae archaeon]|nr:tRNA (cytidine(56)-2'-O)-methyltransferase [Nitrososphaeraceae archaeon]
MSITVLRLGHRLVRDDRTTTHVALVSRAFGCKKIFMTDVDDSILQTIRKICDDWGGSNEFDIEIIQDWKSVLNSWKRNNGIIVHLTMYGLNIENISLDFGEEKNILIVIGASKVPKEIYSMADMNIAVGNQPHSEIAALAIFLDRFYRGKELVSSFQNAKMKIIPSSHGKRVKISKLKKSS